MTQATGTTTIATPPEKPKTFNDILLECVAKAGAQDLDLEGIAKCVWYGGPWAQPVCEFKQGQKNPLNPSLLIFAIFEDSEEFRIYSLAVADAKNPDKETAPPSVYHLQKRGAIYSAHSMSFGLFQDKVVEEFVEVAFGDVEAGDVDEIECPTCGVEVPHLVHCGACGAKLPEDEDEKDEDEKDETEEKPAVNGTVAASVPS